MGYSDQKFQTRSMERVLLITGTATASGTNALTGADLKTEGQPTKFIRRSVVTNIEVVNHTAPAANSGSFKLIVKNGTNTVAVDTGLGSGAAGDARISASTAANSTFTASGAPTFVVDGTSTASGQSLGTFAVWFEVQELPS